MPLLKPKKYERKQKFIVRFLKNKRMKKDFKDNKQRIAIAYKIWKTK